MTPSDLGIVVVNYASHDLLELNLVGLTAELEDARVVVVDNYSTHVERGLVVRLCARYGWTPVVRDINDGFGAGVDAGVAQAERLGAKMLLVLNPDLSIDAASVSRMVDRIGTGSLTLVAPLILRPDGSVWSDGNELVLKDGLMRSRRSRKQGDERYGVVPWLSGACLMFTSDLWHRVGGLGAEYFMYWEDVELSFRVLSAGGSVHVETNAVAVHEEGGTQRTRSDARMSDLYYYFNVRNRLLFAARNLDADALRRWRRTSVRRSGSILLRGGRRQFLHSLRPLTSALRGLADGLRLSRRAVPRTGNLRVLLSYPPPAQIRNPYNDLLVMSLRELGTVNVEYFSWRRAIFGAFDVFHVHWPEATMGSPTAGKRLGKQVAFSLLLCKTRLTRTAWVRTVHNLGLPQDRGPLETLVLRAEELSTTLRIILSPTTRIDPRRPQAVIPHGHYIDWFSRMERARREPRRIAFVGGIRRYKGVPSLIEAFRQIDDESLTLSVSGRLSHAAYDAELRALAAGDQRIEMSFGFVSDEELVRQVTGAGLLVLPYPEMHNSGMVLCSLSLATPVLVPNNELNRMLREEVGHEWLFLFDEELDADCLLSAIRWAQTIRRDVPDLSRRDWARSAQRHVDAYERAVRLVRGFPRDSVSSGAGRRRRLVAKP